MRMLLSFTCLLLCTACATITGTTMQNVQIITPRVTGASCTLTDQVGDSVYLPETPGVVTLKRGKGPLMIQCTKLDYKPYKMQVDEEPDPAVLGNVVNPVGAYIDMTTGAAVRYPSTIYVWIEPVWWKSLEEKNAWAAEKKAYDQAIQAKKEADAQISKQPPPSKR